MRTEFAGDVLSVRAVEDCIRVTRKYTKGVFRKPVVHPIQGEEFPSRVLTEYYEVYPDLDLDEIMSLSQAIEKTIDWFWGDVLHIDVFFHYSYTTDKAKIIIHGGDGVVRDLGKGIPGLKDILARLVNGNSKK